LPVFLSLAGNWPANGGVYPADQTIIDGVLEEAGKRSIEELELERARVLLGLLTTRPGGEKVAQAATAHGGTPARTK
jgi:hypothetical protein